MFDFFFWLKSMNTYQNPKDLLHQGIHPKTGTSDRVPALDRCSSTRNSDKRRGNRPFDLHSEEVSVPMCETLVVLAATITKLLIQSPQLDQSPEYDDVTPKQQTDRE